MPSAELQFDLSADDPIQNGRFMVVPWLYRGRHEDTFCGIEATYQEVLRLRPDDPGVQAALKRLGEGAESKS